MSKNSKSTQKKTARASKQTTKRFLASVKKYRFGLLGSALLALMSAGLVVAGPYLLGLITTEAFDALRAGQEINFARISSLLLILVGLYLISAIVNYVNGYVAAVISAKYAKEMKRQILAKFSRLPMSYFDKTQNGDTMSIMTNDVETISFSLAQTISQVITNLTLLIGYLGMMIYISIPMSAVSVIVVPISMLAVSKVVKKGSEYYKKQRKTLGKLNSEIEENYGGQLLVKANNHAEKSKQDFATVNEKLYQETFKGEFYGSLTYPITHLFLDLAFVGICLLGGYYALIGALAVGSILAFLQYVSRFTQPIADTAQLSSTIQQTLAAADRVFNFLEEPEEAAEDFTSQFKSITRDGKFRGEVEFSHVNFSYDGVKPIIKDFSIKIEPGMQVAIVGPTGAGKTTIVSLLMRFYDIQSGEIKIDGVSTKQMKRSEVRSLFGMVLQDTWLFSGTILENLKYGSSNVTFEQVEAAAKMTGVDHFIKSLPEGYETKISEDSDNISAGEKQLLTITRAIITNPKMMILDEATSNVDTRTEQIIQRAFDKLTEGRTSFVIAHRLSTIRNADIILVMKEGNIVEHDNHDELMKLDGFYAELYNSQFSEEAE